MKQKVLLITPPFTQLNTPYPATAYLKGFLNTRSVTSFQMDLGIEVILSLFSKTGLRKLFHTVEAKGGKLSANASRICRLKERYLSTIDPAISFLQDKNPTLAHLICTGNYLPEASRFQQMADLEWAFGSMGIRDKARHLVTLYLEDISDLIVEAVDPHFGFSRYAERLARSAKSFDGLYNAIQQYNTYIDDLTIEILQRTLSEQKPQLVALSAPFPGNLYSAFKCGQWIRKNHPEVKVCLGGGFANTELRSLTDPRVFEFIDFITLDDGEAPLVCLLDYLDGKIETRGLKRCFTLVGGEVKYYNGSLMPDFKQKDVGTPDYSDLLLDKYLSVIEVANPMHRLWSDGRWNKLTLAHGCYWGKCTFCDISLDYIKIYEATTAKVLVDRIEELIEQTGQNGFHFVDEAAPPALMREVALEILRRKLTVVWWTNIRFEKSFSADLCRLLAASGCIAVSGGLEVASDRLLELIQKGVTVKQVARVAAGFTEAGIMVHAYLMYGFPTQTAQETIDALEMVRQMFQLGIVQSGFWHQFAMTAHSPVGMNPPQYKVSKVGADSEGFARNDLEHEDPTGAPHDRFSNGLKKSLFNYMHGMCFDFPHSEWFDFKVPRTSVHPDYIEDALVQTEEKQVQPTTRMIWLGDSVYVSKKTKIRKGREDSTTFLNFGDIAGDDQIEVAQPMAEWLCEWLPRLKPGEGPVFNWSKLTEDFEQKGLGDLKQVWQNKLFKQIRQRGLLSV